MDSTFITYLGLIVGIAILGWGSLVLFRYYHKPRGGVQRGVRNLNDWVPFAPLSSTEEEYLEAIDEEDVESPARLQARARQNGHSNDGLYDTEHKQKF